MNSEIINKLINDDYFLYSELKKLAKEIKLEENVSIEQSIQLAVSEISYYTYQTKEKILYRFYQYDEKISNE